MEQKENLSKNGAKRKSLKMEQKENPAAKLSTALLSGQH